MKTNIVEGLQALAHPIEDLQHLAGNARQGDVEAVKKSLKTFGQHKPLVVQRQTNEVLIGNHTLRAAKELGWDTVAVLFVDDDKTTAKARAIADNRASELGGFDADLLAEMIADVAEADEALLDVMSYTYDDLEALLAETSSLEDLVPEAAEDATQAAPGAREWPDRPEATPVKEKDRLSLSDRFLVPPFSILNAREGWWQERKRAWIDLGIEGELGRDDKPRTWFMAAPAHHVGAAILVEEGAADKKRSNEENDEDLLYGEGSTSIFDPVLCEIAYRWFCPHGGLVLDPYAGGSVRGIVAAKLGRRYIGIDIRENQILADRKQGDELLDGVAIVPAIPSDSIPELTPVQEFPDLGIWAKREDLYAFAGVRGAKVRTCVAFIERAKKEGVGVVTAGARHSPQVNFVAQIANRLGVRCRVHVPSGPLTPELLASQAAGAKLVQHEFGYNTVIVARAREDAAERGWVEIPYGMESQEAVDFTRPQAANIPPDCKRIVNATGSGMTLAGMLWGLQDAGLDIPVLGVCVGSDPRERLDKWAPKNWRDTVELIEDPSAYETPATQDMLDDVILDPYYEAKCLPYLQDGDCLWISAIRPSVVPAEAPTPTWIVGDALETDTLVSEEADLLFTCSPYGDLEVYSDDPRDLSTMDYPEFIAAFAESMAKAYQRVKDDSFAVIVVGDYRNKDGYYNNFPGDAVKCMEAAGFKYHNEVVLVTHAGSLPIRAARQFNVTRKIGKTHQQVLVFIKGDARAATTRCGPVVSVDTTDLGEE